MRLFNGNRKIVGAPAQYHIVKRSHEGDFETYDIYYENRPCLRIQEEFTLNRDLAQKIANLLNKGN